MTVQEAKDRLVKVLSPIYKEGESKAISLQVLEYLTGLSSVQQVMHRQTVMEEIALNRFEKITAELLDRKPLQYILETCWFMDLQLFVNQHVLIPRPETEELADWMIRDLKLQENPLILDVGTGSGCLALALKKHLPASPVFACDVCEEALVVAGRNARQNHLEISFFKLDLLAEEIICPFTLADVIVSNPPYIPLSDLSTLEEHVINHEPHLALFAPTEDPLLFYRAIAKLAMHFLKEGGSLYLELHAPYAKETADLMTGMGFVVAEIKKDMQGLERMLKVNKGIPSLKGC